MHRTKTNYANTCPVCDNVSLGDVLPTVIQWDVADGTSEQLPCVGLLRNLIQKKFAAGAGSSLL